MFRASTTSLREVSHVHHCRLGIDSTSSPHGCELLIVYSSVRGWKIGKDRESGVIELKSLEPHSESSLRDRPALHIWVDAKLTLEAISLLPRHRRLDERFRR